MIELNIKEKLEEMYNNLKQEVSNFIEMNEFRKPCLAIVTTDQDDASKVYIRNKMRAADKVGIETRIEVVTSVKDLIQRVCELDADYDVDGIIVQLPLPEEWILPAPIKYYISPEKDVDGFRNDSDFEPCTPEGILILLDMLGYNSKELRTKTVCVAGRSEIVGRPMVDMLVKIGATVININSKTSIDNTVKAIEMSDIIISAIGKPKYWTGESWGNKIWIDVGINRDENGKLCGDIDYERLKDSEKYISPVPGGVGLMTVYTLMQHTVDAYIHNNI